MSHSWFRCKWGSQIIGMMCSYVMLIRNMRSFYLLYLWWCTNLNFLGFEERKINKWTVPWTSTLLRMNLLGVPYPFVILFTRCYAMPTLHNKVLHIKLQPAIQWSSDKILVCRPSCFHCGFTWSSTPVGAGVIDVILCLINSSDLS